MNNFPAVIEARSLIARSFGIVVGILSPLHAWAAERSAIEQVLVTAQRRTQNIMDVPLSVASYSPAQLEQQGIRAIEDLSRLTPSLRFQRTAGVSGNNASDISIRGIASDVGSATTAIYIDDTPIQIRSIGYFGGNTYPLVFDLERIEVLRGPQEHAVRRRRGRWGGALSDTIARLRCIQSPRAHRARKRS